MTEPGLTPETRARLRTALAEQIPKSWEVLDRSVAARSRLHLSGAERFATAFNLIEFVFLSQFDLQCVSDDLLAHTPGPRGALYCRVGILVLGEALKGLKVLLAKRYREELLALLSDRSRVHEYDSAMKSAHSQVTKLFDDLEANFGEVRNAVIAHMDTDADVRVAQINALDPDAIFGAVTEASRIYPLLGPPLLAVLAEAQAFHEGEGPNQRL